MFRYFPKVAVIGAGMSGITAGILLPKKVPGIQLTILEKNHDVVSAPAKGDQWLCPRPPVHPKFGPD